LCFFLKVIISVRGGYCDYSPADTKTYLAMPVTVAMINREWQVAVWVLTLMKNMDKQSRFLLR